MNSVLNFGGSVGAGHHPFSKSPNLFACDCNKDTLMGSSEFSGDFYKSFGNNVSLSGAFSKKRNVFNHY